jgi:RimJ/RimL family protein N-acetyltransferase
MDTIILIDQLVALVLLARHYHDDLCDATRDSELWKLWYTNVPASKEMRAEIERSSALLREGGMVPWAVRHLASSRVVGMTTFMNVEAHKPRVEIDST